MGSRLPIGILDLGASVQHPILEVLGAADLCRLGATCKLLQRRCMGDATLWRGHCATLLGPETAALHSVAAPHHERRTPSSGSRAHSSGSGDDSGRSDSCDSTFSLESADEEAAEYWAGVYRAGVHMDGAYFLEGASERFAASVPEELADKLARAGHTTTPVGSKLVIAGGILLSPSRTMDAMVVDPARLTISRPWELGEAPETRFRHTAVAAPLQPGSPLHAAAATRLADLGVAAAPETGTLLLLWGGYNTLNAQFGGPDIQGLWVAEGARTVAWLPLTSSGEAPSRRFHHTADAFAGGRKMIVLGGEGHACDDSTDAGCPAVYVLDMPSLVWQRVQTTSETADACPGACALHLCTVRMSPGTGHEELVVITGPDQENSRPHGGMLPRALDLSTFSWRHGAFRDPAAHVVIPAARQRPGKVKLAGQWLLVGAGTPLPFGTSGCLTDIHRLHLPTLTWRGPLRLHAASASVQCNAGFSADGLVMFGGITISRAGISPVARHDAMLLGRPAQLSQQLPSRPVTPVPAQSARPTTADTAGQHDVQLSPTAAVGLQQVLQQVLAACGSRSGSPSATCSHCGQAAKTRPPAQLVVAGVLATYAAQLKAADDFTPAWPQAFPEHLRNGSGSVSASKVPELATPATDEAAALSLAWFRGVRAVDDNLVDAPDMALTEAEPSRMKAAGRCGNTAAADASSSAGATATATASTAAAVSAEEMHTAAATSAPGGSSADTMQSPSAPQTPLGLPSLPPRQPRSSAQALSAAAPADSLSEETAACETASQAEEPSLDDTSANAAEPQASVCQVQPAAQLQTDPSLTAPGSQLQLLQPPPPLTTVQQLGRRLQQLSVVPPPPPPPAAGAAVHAMGPGLIPPPAPPTAPYPGQQPGTPAPAPPHGYSHPMLHSFPLPPPPPPGHLPPTTPEAYHRMVALQASLARWQHPGASSWRPEAAADWTRSAPAAGAAPGYQHGQVPASPHRYQPVPPPPPQHAAAARPPQGGRQQPSGSWAAWAQHWQQAGRPSGMPAALPPVPPQQRRQPFWQGAAPAPPPPPLQHQPPAHSGSPAAAWSVGPQVAKGPPPPPPPPFPPPAHARTQNPPVLPHHAYGPPAFPAGAYGHAAAGFSVDGGMLQQLPGRSAQPRRSRGGQRRRKAAAAAAAAAALGTAAATGQPDAAVVMDASGAPDGQLQPEAANETEALL